MNNYKKIISEKIENYIKNILTIELNTEIETLFVKPEKDNFGDLSLPCFKLSSLFKKSPVQIAEILIPAVDKLDFVEKIENFNGYLNIYIKLSHLFSNLVNSLEHNCIPEIQSVKGKTILVEFSSPNIAKPFSIGHLRSTVIGNFIANLFRAVGGNVVAINHIGDWGTQFGKLIVAFSLWGSDEKLKSDPVNHLLELYVKFHSESEENPQLEADARQAFKNLENLYEKETELWENFREFSLLEFNKTYKRLNVKFDHTTGESFYSDKIDSVVKLLENKKLLTESENAVVVKLDNDNMPPCLIKKSDGATLYATRDLAAAIYRHSTFDFDNLFYVVGSEQSLHFKQFFKVLELAGQSYYEKMEHISFGLYRFKDGKMSTRKGKVVFLNDVLDEAVSGIIKLMKEKNPDLTEIETKDIAETLGISAVIFNDLKNDRQKDVNFSWKEVLNMEGDSGPYITYSYVRCLSILRKSNINDKFDFSDITVENQWEELLIRKLVDFQSTLFSCILTRKSHHLTNYLLDLTKKFHSFYHNCRVIGEDNQTTALRLMLVKITAATIKSGAEILGMKLPNKM